MKTEHFRLALAIAREGSISKAAESLFISQPTASNMLKSLENELGYPLFNRARSGMIPTVAGSEFLEHASAIERSLDAISQITQPVKQVNLIVKSIGPCFTEIAFEKLCEKHYEADSLFSFSYEIENDILAATRAVENDTADVAVIMHRKKSFQSLLRDATKKNLEVASISEICLELTCKKGHPIIKNGSIAYDLLDEYPRFTSMNPQDADSYVPQSLAKRSANVQSTVIMGPFAIRYRLLNKLEGFLISAPVSDEVKETYDLDSLPIEDSDISLLAVYRKNSPKDSIIEEYIQHCRSLF